MFYNPVSIREAIENVNDSWYLPAIQRPYDWGNRNKKEEFIYKLFDSIIREYPIGTLIIWETDQPIPYRPFITDFSSEKLTKIVDRGQWGRKDKLLIYDGQQRLQSLFPCLKHTFHNQVLCFNVLFDTSKDKQIKGFKFFPKHEEPEIGYVKLNKLYISNSKQQSEYEDSVIDKIKTVKPELTKDEEYTIKNNIKQLFKIFVDRDIKLLSYYPLIKIMNSVEVLEIFKRINTTGMTLTKSEVLFSQIKNVQYDYEEKIWDCSNSIKKQTGGFTYSPDNILQLVFLIVKNTVRVDPDRVNDKETVDFKKTWPKLIQPLKSFFSDFIYGEFKINHEKIIPKKPALLPLILYFYYMKLYNKKQYRHFSMKSIINMKKYLIKSQLLDWNLQKHIDKFAGIIKEKCNNDKSAEFPYSEIEGYVEKQDRRYTDLAIDDFEYSRWFSLKIILPNRLINFEKDSESRFNPEIDHIFPLSGQGYPPNFKPNIIWNIQPVKGDINNYKLGTLPKEFFTKYPQYLKDYDFLPKLNKSKISWDESHADLFVESRKQKIKKFLKKEYNLKL